MGLHAGALEEARRSQGPANWMALLLHDLHATAATPVSGSLPSELGEAALPGAAAPC